MKSLPVEKFNESKEEVTAAAVAPVSSVPTVGATCTVDVLTLGLRGSPLFSTPTPVTEYSHPVL